MSASARNERRAVARASSPASSSLADTAVGGTGRGACGRARTDEQPAIAATIAAKTSRRTASGSRQVLLDRADLPLEALDLIRLLGAGECVPIDAKRVVRAT